MVFNFFVLAGDATRDRSVDTVDFARVIVGFGTAGTKIFSQGDFNYDTLVSSLDFNILVANYGKSLPAVAASLPVAAGARSSPFSDSGQAADDLADLLA